MLNDPTKDHRDLVFPIRYYGVFDAYGEPKGFWVSDVFPPQKNGKRHEKIPPEAVEITKAQWQELIDHQPRGRFLKGAVTILDLEQKQ